MYRSEDDYQMPPKRRANPQPQSEHLRKLTRSKELEPAIRSIVCHLMFTAGDSASPHPENESLVVDILKNELVLLLEDVLEVHDHQISLIKLEDLFSVLRSQKSLIARFLKYLTTRVEMASFLKNSRKEVASGDEMDDEEDKEVIDELRDVEEVDSMRKRGKGTADELLLDEVRMALRALGIPLETEGTALREREMALQTVLRNMSSEEYSEFADARRISFQTHSPVPHAPIEFTLKRKKTSVANNRTTLFAWLGEPPIHGEAAQVFVAFLAKEVVAEIVGAALLERNRMNPLESGPLREQYYEEALRKNEQLRKYQRLFVG